MGVQIPPGPPPNFQARFASVENLSAAAEFAKRTETGSIPDTLIHRIVAQWPIRPRQVGFNPARTQHNRTQQKQNYFFHLFTVKRHFIIHKKRQNVHCFILSTFGILFIMRFYQSYCAIHELILFMICCNLAKK